MNKSATHDNYSSLETAYQHFNKSLFGSRLPDHCLITVVRKKGARGFYRHESFTARGDGGSVSEIALNPDSFGRSDREILSTLVHEMVHFEQFMFGYPSRNGYHNREWAQMMEAVGLMPSSTGKPGGKRTGQRVTHYIVEGGAFDTSVNRLLKKKGFKLTIESRSRESSKKRPESKTRFTCPSCSVNCWGKPTLYMICGDCSERMTCGGVKSKPANDYPKIETVPADISNACELLGVSHTASNDELKTAYRKACNKWHPDKQAADQQEYATEMFKQVKSAYEFLRGAA